MSNNQILTLTRKLDASIIHFWDVTSGDMISSKRNIFRIIINGIEHNFKLPIPWKRQGFGISRLSARLGRIDKGNAVFSPDRSAVIVLYFGGIYRIDLETKCVSRVGELENCRNVLHQGIAIGHDSILIGEYCTNFDFKSVKVWRSNDQGRSFHVVHEFPAKSIFHTHGVYLDPFTEDFWIPTGDFEGQCHLYRANPDFSKIEKIGDGSQKYRAVSLMFSQERVSWGMDSPLETSRIISINRQDFSMRQGQVFDAPVWFTKRLEDGLMLLQTTVEPGRAVQTSWAEVFASLDGNKWISVFRAKKDVWPMRLFKFGNIGFADGPQTSERFALFSEALEGIDGQAFEARLDLDRLHAELSG